jgi:hypothetical protein
LGDLPCAQVTFFFNHLKHYGIFMAAIHG